MSGVVRVQTWWCLVQENVGVGVLHGHVKEFKLLVVYYSKFWFCKIGWVLYNFAKFLYCWFPA
ncbi:hypothetical protein M6B38_288545 [Iris pallida]|uniref:Uncharacterized protein n=1 Tax=Iris pallida TaxID=29817 RepID=A0AAX6HX16_IRIPA|nr:hypothetical protein M6B38_288545 [Iris pallida]